ncbi:glycosyltransferase [uncultured Winogradskyella sp.]|uniref:glycosyltransferase n=1 Tax=uncultured Winogradskyella sp. TaxID=395353 RepID=UPI0026084F25|nr:glycosyltransferase [uncultured Winogradskyella sp.]
MSKHISKGYKLLVISDTGMYQKDSHWYAFGPVVTELEYCLSLFSEITWIGFNRNDQLNNASYKQINSDKIKVIALQKVGGRSFLSKINILINYPKMWSVINHQVKKHAFIHVRAPSNPSIIATRLSIKYPDKNFWFKYAGSWVGKTSKSYSWQRNKLKSLKRNSKITVNGLWDNQPKNILAFDNPCLDDEDRGLGKTIVEQKAVKKPYNICFVGGLNDNKGVLNLIEAVKQLEPSLINEINIVGDGVLRDTLFKKSTGLNINFYGYLSKKDVVSIYTKSHYIVLPSKSEGFPKVISEAMNYGCLPIVSSVSCIPQIIGENNGYLLRSIEVSSIVETLIRALQIDEHLFYKMISNNYQIANRFTYKIYLDRIKNEIFELETL